MNELNELLRFAFLVIAGFSVIIGLPVALIVGMRHKEGEQKELPK